MLKGQVLRCLLRFDLVIMKLPIAIVDPEANLLISEWPNSISKKDIKVSTKQHFQCRWIAWVLTLSKKDIR